MPSPTLRTRKTTLEFDEDLFAEAQRVLGTKSLRETVDRAFHEVVRAKLRRDLAERLRTQKGVDLGPDMLEQTRAAWGR